MVAEGSLPHDPQTTGAAENAVKLVKSQFRTLLLGLERQLKAILPFDHPIIAWLVSDRGPLRTRQVRGQDVRSAQQRARGNAEPQKLVSFGGLCRYKARSQEGGIGHTEWKRITGVLLGIERRAQLYMLVGSTKGGIEHARGLLSVPQLQKWDIEAVKGVKVIPWSVHEPTVPEAVRLG